MKTILIVALALSLSIPSFARNNNHLSSRSADTSLSSVGHSGPVFNSTVTHVKGYTKRDGTHVNGYDRTSKDSNKVNNWSAKGNINPETGKVGTR